VVMTRHKKTIDTIYLYSAEALYPERTYQEVVRTVTAMHVTTPV
jgi:hypothetical protein